MKRAVVTVTILVFAVLFAQAQGSSVPPLINYQGKLTDQYGSPLEGTHKLEFSIWDEATPGLGTELWGEQTFDPVEVIGGQFNVSLGPTDAQQRPIVDAFGDSERYLQIQVDGKILFPRQRILTAPYAIRSEHAGKADSATRAESLTGGNVTFMRKESNVIDCVIEEDYTDALRIVANPTEIPNKPNPITILILPTGGAVVIGLKAIKPEIGTTPTSYFRAECKQSTILEFGEWHVVIGSITREEDGTVTLKETLARFAMPAPGTWLEGAYVAPLGSFQTTLRNLTPCIIGLFIERGQGTMGPYGPQVTIKDCQLYAYEVGGDVNYEVGGHVH